MGAVVGAVVGVVRPRRSNSTSSTRNSSPSAVPPPFPQSRLQKIHGAETTIGVDSTGPAIAGMVEQELTARKRKAENQGAAKFFVPSEEWQWLREALWGNIGQSHRYNRSSPARTKGVDVKNLLTMTAVLEVGAGLVFLALPSLGATQLFGAPLATPVASTVARIAGAALIALGVACWLARHDGQSHAVRGLVGTMAFYNAVVLMVLVYAGVGSGLSGSGLWPAVMVHAAMAVWCVTRLRGRPGPSGKGTA